MFMRRVHFILNEGVYPYRVGGMEIFNYYLIDALGKELDISYSSFAPLPFRHVKFYRYRPFRPRKFFGPFQLFLHLFCHPRTRCVVFSFSAASWLVWFLSWLTCRVLNRRYFVVIHYGKDLSDDDSKILFRFFNSAERVVAVSEDIKRKYDRKYGLDCKVIYPLVPFYESSSDKESLRRKYGVPVSALVICMVGSLKSMKNPDTILRTLTIFSAGEIQKYNPYVFYAGVGPMEEELRAFAVEKGLENRTFFSGFVPKEKVNEIYKLADIYLIASDFEGTSVSLLEAMFNRKPIIASRVPGIVDILHDGLDCLMFSVRDENALKECIMRLLTQENLMRDIADEARKVFDAEFSYESVIAAYKNLLS